MKNKLNVIGYALIAILLVGTAWSAISEKLEAKPRVVTEEVKVKPKVESKPVTKTTEVHDSLIAGDKGVIIKDVIVALGNDKKNLDELFDYINVKDSEMVQRMILDGKAVVTKANTPITVIKNDLASVQIKINETGEVGWVPFEYVGK